jgi:hypothetical protein
MLMWVVVLVMFLELEFVGCESLLVTTQFVIKSLLPIGQKIPERQFLLIFVADIYSLNLFSMQLSWECYL